MVCTTVTTVIVWRIVPGDPMACVDALIFFRRRLALTSLPTWGI